MTVPQKLHRFADGGRYSATSIGDSNCVWTWEVVSRTARFVTLRDGATGDVRRVGVYQWDGVERARPFGSYSMAPSISADRKAT